LPKSSRIRQILLCRSSASTNPNLRESSSSTDSVISSAMALSGRPCSASVCSTRAAKPGVSWRTDTFTATRKSSSTAPSRRHCASWAATVPSTHSPMGTISPVSSAAGMNSSGVISPSGPASHRSNASAPRTRPLARSATAWYCTVSSLRGSAWRRAWSSWPRRFTITRGESSKNTTEPRSVFLPW